VWKTTGKDCTIASQNCAVYSVFPSDMTSHNKIAQFNWESIAPFIHLPKNLQAYVSVISRQKSPYNTGSIPSHVCLATEHKTNYEQFVTGTATENRFNARNCGHLRQTADHTCIIWTAYLRRVTWQKKISQNVMWVRYFRRVVTKTAARIFWMFPKMYRHILISFK
jgi:hypothetical protein